MMILWFGSGHKVVQMETAKILFLDDMEWRHSSFMKIADRSDRIRVWQVRTAAQAIQQLGFGPFDQVFLDHDLSDEDIMVDVNGTSKVPTGMAVVDYIVGMECPPKQVYVHSCNEPAAREMEARLRSHSAGITVFRIPFPNLIQMMEQSLEQEKK